MKRFVMAMPILPGKEEAWETWTYRLKEEFMDDFLMKHNEFRIHERLFLQKWAKGWTAIFVFTGENLEGYFKYLREVQDDFTKFYDEMIFDLHGYRLVDFDFNKLPELIFDTEDIAEPV